MKAMERLGVLALPVVIAASVGACDSDPAGVEDITGTYQLISVASESLPVLLAEEEDDEYGTVGLVLSEGSLALSGDATYTLSISVQLTANGDVVDEETASESGTYEDSGDSITFTGPQGEVSGTIDGPEIRVTDTVEDVEAVLVFRK